MMTQPVYIHGLGLLTGLDRREHSTWDAIVQGRRLHTRGVVADEMLAGDVRADRAIRIAIPTLKQALAEARWEHKTAGIPLFAGSSKGLILTALEACRAMHDGRTLSEDQARTIACGPSIMGDILSRELSFAPGAHTSIAACASGLFAMNKALRAIQTGEITRAVVVAADASLHPLMESSFDNLGVLSPADAEGKRWCNPFDGAGRGFFLSEAAAAIAISSDTPAGRECIEIENAWTGEDGGHLLAIDETTASLKTGLQVIQQDGKVDFVHAHATGTAHDKYELGAIGSLCGTRPEVFSSKYWLGHSLGAAGLVSLALSVMCHRNRKTLTGKPIADASRSITIAQGFGGHIAVAGLKRVG